MRMTSPLFALAIGVLSVGAGAQSQNRVPAGCAIPQDAEGGRVFYVDPLHGSMANDGSANAPWSTLHDVLARGLISAPTYKMPYSRDSGVDPANPSAPIHAGDTIYLRSGDHGDVRLTGVNGSFIVIAGEPGQHPVIDHLLAIGASKWVLKDLVFRGPGRWLVEFQNPAFQGPSDNIVFEHNTLYAAADVKGWSPADWLAKGVSGIHSDASCSMLRDNRLLNVQSGISISGPNSVVENNTIENFGDDGIDFSVGHLLIRSNHIVDNHDLGDHNHNDGIQGWSFTDSGEENVTIEYNVIVNAVSPNLPFPGQLQGISIFDGKWRNVRILNNTILSNQWHGISLYGARDSQIENNLVLGTDPKKTTWILVTDSKKAQGGRRPSNVVVRGNISTRFVLPRDADVSDIGNSLADTP